MNEPITRPAEARTATWLGFILMCLGMFMAILDIQVVATSLPAIQDALAISRDAMSWIQTAYLIAEIIAIPLTGWLTRVLTLRWLFVTAIGLFTLASIGCAFSGSFAILVGFRVLQGCLAVLGLPFADFGPPKKQIGNRQGHIDIQRADPIRRGIQSNIVSGSFIRSAKPHGGCPFRQG